MLFAGEMRCGTPLSSTSCMCCSWSQNWSVGSNVSTVRFRRRSKISSVVAVPRLSPQAFSMRNVLVMALVAVMLVLGVGVVAFDTPVPQQPVGFLVALVLAAVALLAVGLLVAAVAPSGKAASGIGTMLFFPLMFFAGLYFPREAMPPVLRDISDFTPLGAGVQAMSDASAGGWPQPLHLAVMAAFTMVASLAAAKLFRWE